MKGSRGGRIEFFPVVPKIWCIRRPSYLTCSYVVEIDERRLFFIDAGMSSGGDDIWCALRELRRNMTDVAGCVLTHWHNDHSAGSLLLQNEAGCPIYCHSAEGSMMIRPVNNGWGGRLSRWIPEEGPLVLFKGLLNGGPGVRLEKFVEVQDGELLHDRFRIVLTPGHTPGHLAVFDEKTGTLFAGDALATVGGQVRRMSRPVTEDLDAGQRSIERLLELPVDTLCPGHREPLVDARAPLDAFRERMRTGERWPLFG